LHEFGTIVDDTPCSFGGKQRLETLDGYIIPLSIRSGVPYMDMSPPTPSELDSYPHFTSDMEWNPQSIVDEYPVQDLDLSDNDLQHNAYHPDTINAYGERLPVARQQDIHFRHQQRNHPEIDQLSPNFGFVPCLRIQHTLDHTTQFARLGSRLPMRKHYKSRFPAANVSRLNEVVATNTYFWHFTGMNLCILSTTSKPAPTLLSIYVPANIKLLVALGDGAENEIKAFGTLCDNEIMAYGTLCKCIKDLEDEDLTSDHKVWTLTDVTGHQGTLTESHKDYKGSLYYVLLL
jgi:hypothetical protein